MSESELRILAIPDLPEVGSGVDLAALLVASFDFESEDVCVLAQKVVSKAEDRLIRLDTVQVSKEAHELALATEKDARLVQLILQESNLVLRAVPGVLIVEDRRGWVCANAGIDRSNIRQDSGGETVSLLPADPDESARRIREAVKKATQAEIGVIIADSHGRAWREGTVGVAIGSAGVQALCDRRGSHDRYGYQLQHTMVGVADELASAASLLMGQGDEGRPAVVVRGLKALGDGSAKDLQRPRERDLFR